MTAAVAAEAHSPKHVRQLVSVVVDDAMISLDRVLGAVRRRNMPLVALSVGPGPMPGTVRVFADLNAEAADVDRLVRQLRKLVGVHGASARSADESGVRQLALIRITSPGPRRADLAQVLKQHRMTELSDLALGLQLELSGSPAQIERGLQALAPFGVLDVALSSPVSLEEEGASAPTTISSIRQDTRS